MSSHQIKRGGVNYLACFCTLLGPGHTAARFGILYAERCSFHGYCSKILKLQREAQRSEKRPKGQLLALAAAEKAHAAALEIRGRGDQVSFLFPFFGRENFSTNEDFSSCVACFFVFLLVKKDSDFEGRGTKARLLGCNCRKTKSTGRSASNMKECEVMQFRLLFLFCSFFFFLEREHSRRRKTFLISAVNLRTEVPLELVCGCEQNMI